MKGAPFGIQHFGGRAINALRLEKGFKLWGSEMNLDVDIMESDLDMFVDWNKVTLKINNYGE